MKELSRDNNDKILELLYSINSDNNEAFKFLDFDFEDIFNVAIENRCFDGLLKLIKPLDINGEKVIIFDAFSENMEGMLRNLDVDDVTSTITADEKKELIFQLFKVDYDELDDMKIGNIHARTYEQTALPICSNSDVIRYVEFPLVRAATKLTFLNIPTVDNDVEGVIDDGYVADGYARLVIDYIALSDENKNVADKLIESGTADRYDGNNSSYLSLYVPCSSNDKVSEVSDRMLKLTEGFVLQEIDSRYKYSPFTNSYEYIKNK